MDIHGLSARAMQTKRILAAELMELLEQESLQAITVEQICQRTSILSSAFHLYFEDVYELLHFCMARELAGWAKVMQDSDLNTYLMCTLNDVLSKKRFYSNLLTEEDPTRDVILHGLLTELYTFRLEQLEAIGWPLPGPIHVLATSCAAGTLCSYIQWIRSDFAMTVEEMTTCQSALLAVLREAELPDWESVHSGIRFGAPQLLQ